MKNQCEFVLNHLIDHGYITQTIASNYNIRRLASRIHDLSLQAIHVEREFRTDDLGVRYTRYTMSTADRAFESRRREEGFDWKIRAAA